MRFRGQRHGLVHQLLWSPLAPGTFPRRRPLPVLMGWGDRDPLLVFIAFGRVVFPSCKPQVAVHKGDMPPGATESTLLLTNREKPIIINSFRRGRGARIFTPGV